MFFFFLIAVSSCKKNQDDTKQDIVFTAPANFPAPVYNFASNPVTTAGFELGRKLFYDASLSRDNTISCGSCHQQFNAFVHGAHIVSHGIDNKLGHRNTPTIANMAWGIDFFWDGGVHQLDLVPPNPIKNPVEMDEQLANVLEKLRNDSKYPQMFKSAFGTDEVNTTRFLQAMSQFMNMLVSANSRYDKYVRSEGGTLSSEESEGKTLFEQKCATCHATDLFTDRSFHNNGIQPAITDSGRYAITLDPLDIGKFKTPSLRNIEKTAPYMHNGSLPTLESVLDFYSTNVHSTTTLDTLLQQNGTIGIPLTAEEKTKLIAFLRTLTDEDFIRDARFAEQ
ncbi:MAG: cytochrome-c peroxidase [Bacteroidetes bacterium]|nr:cytochrome-c peroxidase [Bacteroidota bacterium]